MEYVGSFNAVKAGKAYIVEAENYAPNKRIMTFHVDSGASVTLFIHPVNTKLPTIMNKTPTSRSLYPAFQSMYA